MKFRLFFENPHLHLIQIKLELPPSGKESVELFQSKWRPGRYELANYAENVTDISARTSSGKILTIDPTAYNSWSISPSGKENIIVEYKYFANVPDAGGSYFDENQVYINGVNLFFYTPELLDSPCEFTLDLPSDYQVACGLPREGFRFLAEDYHQLVDAPLIASPTLKHLKVDGGGITHHLWFQGEAKPDFKQLELDFHRYAKAQVELFGDYPISEYHYLFQIHNAPFYHGVEHFNSTVIALGPGYKLMEPEIYKELLGVCCHELFHTWNVKAIRPAEMMPYRYNEENYCKLHYITEGVTTYYGDLMLLKGGVWELDHYLEVINLSMVARYYRDSGRNHISLESASYNSWVNGYKASLPNRKISFYTKGAMVAFLLDCRIRKATQNQASLDTVMRKMYIEFGKTKTGYTREDYQRIIEETAGTSFQDYFDDYISGIRPLEPALAEAANYLGLAYQPRILAAASIRKFGFNADKGSSGDLVKQVWEDSPAVAAGLRLDDEIIAVNRIKCTPGQINPLLKHFRNRKTIRLHLFRNQELITMKLNSKTGYICPQYKLVPLPNPSPEQLENRQSWMHVKVIEPQQD